MKLISTLKSIFKKKKPLNNDVEAQNRPKKEIQNNETRKESGTTYVLDSKDSVEFHDDPTEVTNNNNTPKPNNNSQPKETPSTWSFLRKHQSKRKESNATVSGRRVSFVSLFTATPLLSSFRKV